VRERGLGRGRVFLQTLHDKRRERLIIRTDPLSYVDRLTVGFDCRPHCGRAEEDFVEETALQTERAQTAAEKNRIHNLVKRDPRTGLAEDVRRGLSTKPKRFLPKYFYDQLGSQLFEAICLLPEYYLTRAENEILETYSDEIVQSVPGDDGSAEDSSRGGIVALIEMGSGSASKTRQIIEALLRKQDELLFIPVDISATALDSSSRILLQSYPQLRVEAYAADYFAGLAELGKTKKGRTLALFLGSNISNFDPEEALKFLRALRQVLSAGDALLLGADLKKDKLILEAAYNDALGVTAAFNLNVLARINRELGGNFDLRAFQHRALYNEEVGRVEIYIESTRDQTVEISQLEMEVQFAEGEQIHTENSYKYDLSDIAKLAADTGFTRSRTWLDQKQQFSSSLLLAV
jgi:dimethylhistidine N-methyltransferase